MVKATEDVASRIQPLQALIEISETLINPEFAFMLAIVKEANRKIFSLFRNREIARAVREYERVDDSMLPWKY